MCFCGSISRAVKGALLTNHNTHFYMYSYSIWLAMPARAYNVTLQLLFLLELSDYADFISSEYNC